MSRPPDVSIDTFAPAARRALHQIEALLGRERQAWVVGGALRDALLGRAGGDLDVVVPAGALELGRALADRLPGAFVPLDAERGVARVVADVQIDIADLRAPDLAQDLRARDFTVNALAAPLRLLVARGRAPVEDFTGGLADLAARRVRLCGPRSLADDPVRALRVARLAVDPAWSLDPAVAPAVIEVAPVLATVSAERVRDELIGILSAPAAGRGLRLLDRLGVLGVVFPESVSMRRTPQPEPHRFDVWEHSLRAVEAVDQIAVHLDRLDGRAEELGAHLAEGLGDRLTRLEALKLAALLHDVAKPETRAELGGRIRFIGHDTLGAERVRAIAGRLRLSGRAAGVLARLVGHHLRPMHLAQAGGITRRARYRFFRDLADEARDLLLLALADAAAVRGEPPLDVWTGPDGAVVRSLMQGAPEDERSLAAPPLLTGEDVMEAMHLAPGPAVGRLLALVREAQAVGLVSTRAAALAHLRRAGPALLDTREGDP